MSSPLLEVRDLAVTFNPPTGAVHAVRGVDFTLQAGEVLGVVGESGCGKSASLRALLGLAPASADVTGSVSLRGSEGTPVATATALRSISAMVYQNPGAALNPVFTIGRQLAFVAGTDDSSVLTALLDQVGLPEPETALGAYPHEFSGGMRQRAVIAMALAQEPEVLVADEPTTALDVTTQAQILDLLIRIRDERGLAVLFVSHDLAVVRRIADSIAVLYAGRVVETGRTANVLADPQHPYTQALVKSTPGATSRGAALPTIAGQVPDGRSQIDGCAFAPRCDYRRDECMAAVPPMRSAGDTHSAACVLIGDA